MANITIYILTQRNVEIGNEICINIIADIDPY
jgi:hypothetical protein